MSFALFDQYGQYIMGLGAVLILMGLMTWVIQKLNLFGLNQRRGSEGVSLTLLSSLQLDPKKRLVAIEFNKRKHLILLGPTSDTVIESEDLPSPLSSQQRSFSSEQPHPERELSRPTEEGALRPHPSPMPPPRPFAVQKNPSSPQQTPKPASPSPLPKELRP